MVDADLGLTIAWNGCICNYKQLRDELKGYGYRFFSTSDSEVLIKAYHRWGDDFVSRLQGMFAFAMVAGRRVTEYRGAFFDRDATGVQALLGPGRFASGDPSRQFVSEHFARAGAETGIDRALRLDTTVMLVGGPGETGRQPDHGLGTGGAPPVPRSRTGRIGRDPPGAQDRARR